MSSAEAKQRPAREQSPPALVNVIQLAADLYRDAVRDQRHASTLEHLASWALDAAETFAAEHKQRLSRE